MGDDFCTTWLFESKIVLTLSWLTNDYFKFSFFQLKKINNTLTLQIVLDSLHRCHHRNQCLQTFSSIPTIEKRKYEETNEHCERTNLIFGQHIAARRITITHNLHHTYIHTLQRILILWLCCGSPRRSSATLWHSDRPIACSQ